MSVGTQLAGYRLEELVGRGGHGRRLSGLRSRAGARRRAEAARARVWPRTRLPRALPDESELAASLEHPNVVPIHDAGEVDGQLYLVMRYVEGSDLKQLLADERRSSRRGRSRSARRSRRARRRACPWSGPPRREALERAARPQRARLPGRLRPFAATLRAGARLRGRRSLGTPAYVAPEQIEGKEVDGRADQYSLGLPPLRVPDAVEPPFPRGSEAAILFAHLEEPPPAPPGLEGVIAEALDKDPAARYPSCVEFIADARDALGIEESPRGVGRSPWQPSSSLSLPPAFSRSSLRAETATRARPRRAAGSCASTQRPTGRRRRSRWANEPNAVAVAPTGVWVANRGDGTVWRIDPRRTGSRVEDIRSRRADRVWQSRPRSASS